MSAGWKPAEAAGKNADATGPCRAGYPFRMDADDIGKDSPQRLTDLADELIQKIEALSPEALRSLKE